MVWTQTQTFSLLVMVIVVFHRDGFAKVDCQKRESRKGGPQKKCAELKNTLQYQEVSRNVYISKNCRQICRCGRNDEYVCQPLCPPPKLTVDATDATGYDNNNNNKANCTVYELLEKTSCKCWKLEALCQRKGGDFREKAEQPMTESLEFKIILSTLTILATLLVVSILIVRKSKCRSTLTSKYCQNSAPNPSTKHQKKQSKWSIMLNKRPLPKLPPEGKMRSQNSRENESENNLEGDKINNSHSSNNSSNRGGLTRNRTLEVEQLDTSRKSYTVTTTKPNDDIINIAVDDASARRREASLSESSNADYAQYNYNVIGVGSGVVGNPPQDHHYDGAQASAYAYAKYGPDYACAETPNQQSYATIHSDCDAKQGIYETFVDGKCAMTEEDLYQTLNHNYEIEYDDGYDYEDGAGDDSGNLESA